MTFIPGGCCDDYPECCHRVVEEAQYTARGVRFVAEKELREERFRAAVEIEKERLRNYRPLLHRLFPFVITISRRPK